MKYNSILKDKIYRLFDIIEIDRAVFYGIMATFWGVMGGPVTAILITMRFTPEYQGYYYTFGGILSLQVFVQLGLGTVIIQFASHEWFKLRIDENGYLTGDKVALSRLASLARLTIKWYVAGGAIITFGLGLIGYIFFLPSHTPNINWFWPWFSFCFITGIATCLIPIWSLLEGCNQVSALYSFRFFQGIITNLAIWAAIFLGARLWSLSVSLIAGILCGLFFIKYKYLNFFKSLLFIKSLDSRISWRKEILPMQWRIALSWISGYLVFSLFTPVFFHYYGPVIAGQFGMTWNIVNMVFAVSGAWLFPKVPRFGMLIAEKKYVELDSLFSRITRIYVIITILVAIACWFAIYIIIQLKIPFAARLLPLFPTTVFLIAEVIVMLSLPFSAYLRAHKKEPLLFLSLCSGVLIALSNFILGKYYSVNAIAFGYLGVNLIIVPFVVLIWYRCRAKWHAI